MIKKLLFLCAVALTGCCTSSYTYTPFKTFYCQPPGDVSSWRQAIQLEDIDNSGIYVYTNGDFWYSGPRPTRYNGWIPIANGREGWWPLPGQIWTEKVIFVQK
jgi:hypothetical protein